MDEWWNDIDSEVLECLRNGGPMSPAEVGRRLGFSEAAAASIVSALAKAGKVRISAVEIVEAEAGSGQRSRQNASRSQLTAA